MSKLSFIALALLVSFASALEYIVEGTLLAPSDRIVANIKIALDGGKYAAITNYKGQFSIYNVPAGTYALTVIDKELIYPQHKLDINEETGRIRAIEYAYPGAPKKPTPYPLEMRPVGVSDYFFPRPSFGFRDILANPMLLIMGFMMIAAFAMPKMMEGMDPEQLKKMQEEQEDQPQTPADLWAAMMGTDEKEKEEDAVPAINDNQSKKKNSKKKSS